MKFPQLQVPAFLLSAGLIAGALLGSASIAVTQPAQQAPPSNPPAGEQPSPTNRPSSAPTPASDSWQNFTPPGGRFKVAFPSSPTEKSDEGNGFKSYLAESSQGFYILMHGDLSSEAEAKRMLLALPAEFVKGINGKIISQKKISLKRNAGQEFRFEMPVDEIKVFGKGRIYQVGKRVYILVSAAPEQESGKFFNSFGLVRN